VCPWVRLDAGPGVFTLGWVMVELILDGMIMAQRKPITTTCEQRCGTCAHWKLWQSSCAAMGRCGAFAETKAAHETCEAWELDGVVQVGKTESVKS